MIKKPSISKKETSQRYNERHTGFPSPAMDYMDGRLDLHDLLINKPYATFYFKVVGNDMHKFGIWNNDILVVDKSIAPKHDNIIVATLNGKFIVRKINKTKKSTYLISDTNNPLDIRGLDIKCWGTVTASIKRYIKHLNF